MLRTAAALAALLGGLAWLATYVLDRTDRAAAADAAEWAGLVLLAIATMAAGAGLVSRSATWLRVLVAICFTLLVWSVLQVLAEGVDERLLQAAVGGVAALLALVALARRPPRAPDDRLPGHASGTGGRRTRGSHAR